MNNYNKKEGKILTLAAFLIGFSLIDVLDTQEQNSVGNFFMLLGQTLCTSNAEIFRRELKNQTNINNINKENSNNSMDLLNRVREVFDKEITNLEGTK